MINSSSYQQGLLPKLCPTSYGSIQNCYNSRDRESSKYHHDNRQEHSEDFHNIVGGDVVKSIVFGGLDGIITTFAVITSAYANHLAAKVVLILGFANVLADAISMGHGDYFSEKTEQDYIRGQYQREKWEMENYMEGEMDEMVRLYKEKYEIPEGDAREILSRMAVYPKLFLDHMMVVELELMPPDPDANPRKNGIVTFCSFLLFGSLPLIVFIFGNNIIWSSCAAITALGILGWIRASFTQGNRLLNILVTIANGCFSAGAAYGVSSLLTYYA